MKTIFRLTFKSLMGKKVRFMLTSLSVILGVMFTVGVFIVTDSLRSAFGDLSQDIAGHIDLSVRSYQDFGNTLNAPPVDPELARAIAQVNGIQRADPGIIEFNIGVAKPNGKLVSGANNNAPAIGVNWPSSNDGANEDDGNCKDDNNNNDNNNDSNDSQGNNNEGDDSEATEDDFGNVFIAKDQDGKCLGRKPVRSHEFAINATAFEDHDLKLGPGYSITFPSGTQDGYELVGVFNLADRDEDKVIGGTVLTAFDLATAERDLNQGKGWDSIDIVLKDGADLADVEQNIIEAVEDTGLVRVVEPDKEGLPRLIIGSIEEVAPEPPDGLNIISLQDIVGQQVDLVVLNYQPDGIILNLPPVAPDWIPIPDIVQTDSIKDDIKAVAPGVFGLIEDVVKPSGEPVRSGSNIIKIGINWSQERDFAQTFIAQGRPPTTHKEFAINTSAFESSDLTLGERYTITSEGSQSEYELVGVFNYADRDEDQSAGVFVAAFDLETAKRDLNQDAGWDIISIILENTADPETVKQAIGEIVETTKLARVIEPEKEGLPRLEIISSQEVVQEQEDTFNTIIAIFQTFLLSFAGVILLVSIFVIFNTFTIILGQRIREIGLLRALGATDRQIFSSIFGEALAVGLFSSGAGLVAGLGLAYLLRWIRDLFNFDIPIDALPLLPRTVVVAFIVGTVVTLVSALVPALRSRRVSPMSALRDDLTIGVRLVKRRVVLGSILTVPGLAFTVLAFMSDWQQMALLSLLGTLLLALGGKRLAQQINLGHWLVLAQGVAFLLAAVVGGLDTGEQATAMGIGALVVIIGVNLISPMFVPQLMRGIGFPIQKLTQTTGKLSTQNASRTPGRTSTTAAALMIGLALVSTITLVATSLKATFQNVLDDTVKSDWFICVDNCSDPTKTFSPQLAQELRGLEQVDSVLTFRVDEEAFKIVGEEDEFGTARLSGTMAMLGTDFNELGSHLDLGKVQGSFENLPPNSLAVHDETAEDYGLVLGSILKLRFGSKKEGQFTVAALYEDARIMGDWAIDIASWNQYFEASQVKDTFASVISAPNAAEDIKDEDVLESNVQAALEQVANNYPAVNAQTRQEFYDNLLETFTNTVKSDWFICIKDCSDPNKTFSPQLAQELRELEQVDSTLTFRLAEKSFRVVGQDELGGTSLSDTMDLRGTNFNELGSHLDLGKVKVQGSFENPPSNSLAVHDKTAEDYGLVVGDDLTLRFVSGQEVRFTVVALYEDARIMGDWAIDIASWNQYFEASQVKDAFVSVINAPNTAEDTEDEDELEKNMRSALKQVTDSYSDVETHTRQKINDNLREAFDDDPEAAFGKILGSAVRSGWFVCDGSCADPTTAFNPQLAGDLRSEFTGQSLSVLPLRLDEEGFRIVAEDEAGNAEVSSSMALLGTDFNQLENHFNLGVVQGSIKNAAPNSIAISDDVASDYDLTVGDTITLRFGSEEEAQFTVAARYRNAHSIGNWIIDFASWNQHFQSNQNQAAFVWVHPTDVLTAIRDVAADDQAVNVQTRQEFNDSRTGQIDNIVLIVNIFLFLALVVAFLGIANTLALSIIERTRELGLLRAVGMKRGQMLMMILWEGVLISVFGGLLGIGMGLLFGSTAVTVIPDDFISTLAIPWRTFVYYIIGAGIAGLVSALLPARRASRLNVLDAIANE